MNDEKLVLVEYHNPERNEIEYRPGWLREATYHLLLIQERIERIDLFTYTVIPRDFVKRITELKPK